MSENSTKYTDAIFDVLKETYPFYIKCNKIADVDRIFEMLLTTYKDDSNFSCYPIGDLMFFTSEDHYLAAIILL